MQVTSLSLWDPVLPDSLDKHSALPTPVLQLAGIAVLAIGLWLRFDTQTKSIFDQENNQSNFYTGEMEEEVPPATFSDGTFPVETLALTTSGHCTLSGLVFMSCVGNVHLITDKEVGFSS